MNEDRESTYQIKVSYLQIYNEEITDLLVDNDDLLFADAASTTKGERHHSSVSQIREAANGLIYVDGLRTEIVHSFEDVERWMKLGESNRVVGETKMNATSSRSHAAFLCTISQRLKSDTTGFSLKSSKLNLIDLAGSERQRATGAKGKRLREGANINKSLSALGNVICKSVYHHQHSSVS